MKWNSRGEGRGVDLWWRGATEDWRPSYWGVPGSRPQSPGESSVKKCDLRLLKLEGLQIVIAHAHAPQAKKTTAVLLMFTIIYQNENVDRLVSYSYWTSKFDIDNKCQYLTLTLIKLPLTSVIYFTERAICNHNTRTKWALWLASQWNPYCLSSWLLDCHSNIHSQRRFDQNVTMLTWRLQVRFLRWNTLHHWPRF